MITVKEILEIIEAQSVQENTGSNNRVLIHQDFEIVAEEIVNKLTIPVVVECKHDFEPYYNWCSELDGYRCEKCGEEKD